jgi:DNA-binding transcriptional MerR regulator
VTASPADSGVRLSIGEVLTRLRSDFPDVTISKIRFLESEGLIEPGRTPAGYRKFSLADVQRLRYILSVQRDRYLPLKVIREQLDAIDRGLEPTDGGGVPRLPSRLPGGTDTVGSSRTSAAALPRLSRTELLDNAGVEEALLVDLEAYGLVKARRGYFDEGAVGVTAIAAQMARFGLEPRHLRAFKTAADREVALIEQAVTPIARGRSVDAKERAAEAVGELADLSSRLHTCLIRDGLRRRR